LINPRVKAVISKRVCLAKYNAFQPWPGENADLIIAANILNRSYFSEPELVLIMQNIKEAVKKPGLIALIDNRKVEQSSIIKVTNSSAVIVSRVGNGSDVENLMLKVLND
jgi:chemotaxis methyl-accepting protein methylase